MSDNYRALTRTYRPVSFDDIVSQEHVSSTLKNAISQNRLAHAYMFCGPRGVGKTSMARVLARTVNQIDREVDGESLNKTLNVVEIDAASNNSVDDIRDLRERVRIPPQNGRYKVYIIDEVHMLSKQAFNALLKTLEEPPDHIIFIFATTEPHKVLPTILSRVQRFDFKRIGIEDIVARLKKVCRDEHISIDEESLHVIAKKADGALRDALGLLDQAIAFCGNDIQHEELLRALNVVSTERMFDFMKTVEQQDAGRGLELIDDLLHEGYDIQEYLVGLTEHIRNLYVARKSEKMHLVEASAETKKRYNVAAKAFSEDDLMRMLHLVSEAQYKIKEAQQPKIQFEITLLKLIHMERSQNLNTLISELRQLKKKLRNQPRSDLMSVSPGQGTSGRDGAQNGTAETADNQSPAAEEGGQKEEKGNRREQEDTDSDAEVDVDPEPEADIDAEAEPEHTSGPAPKTGPAQKSAGKQSSGTEPDHSPAPDPASSSPPTPDSSAEPAHIQKESSSSRPDRSSPADSFDRIFDDTSLGEQTPSGESSATPDTEAAAPPAPRRAPGDVTLDEVGKQWEDFIEHLRKEVPQMLYFQMQRVEPVSLEKGTLLLRCNDDFAKKIVDENSRQLGKILEQQIDAFLHIDCRVQRNNDNAQQSESPYERFKKLQERDPTIKTLVDLFGAELDYNLNQ
ncbi:DNA polymerase-3 subunit gamma/tau [Fodinibius roseus]|uniref:DNA polymerase III subunit gamma/tau n=1 Tax=Fodinibius roseus TaxID=1194090 RepID=A0A1M4ZHG5_9BACT|nr:DNA polymerase III subunit gamma/tau [Fodinibius roseus]SHF17247.1 DNA polymerase-3 subunit gamma/tau [Fodinibius roseus]